MTEEKEIAVEPVEGQAQVETQESVQEQTKRDVDHNWEKANEVLKLQKQEIEELKIRLTEMSQPKQQEEPDEFASLDPDDYLTVGKAKELAKKMAAKEAKEAAKQIVHEYAQQQSVAQDEQRMRSKFEDYDYVIENYAIPLIKNDPALAYRIQQSKNPAETAYKLGKLSDSYEESKMKQQTSPKAEKILKNASRPVSSNAVGTPLKNQADDFSKMSSQQVWEMSQKFARGA